MRDPAPRALCFGEIVVDRRGDVDLIGGAPMNVGWYLGQLGVSVGLISAVGRDDGGDRAIRDLRAAGIDTTWIARRPEPTGVAEVLLVDGEPRFEISEHAALDSIEAPARSALDGELIYFGTFAQRSEFNRATLGAILDTPFRHRFVDVNLRPPFYTDAVVLDSLKRATALKMNEEEWGELSRIARVARPSDLLDRFDLGAVVVSLGPAGAELFTHAGAARARAKPVTVVDVVGAGDAFSAVMAAALARNVNLETALQVACDAGAFVVEHHGTLTSLPDDIREALDRA